MQENCTDNGTKRSARTSTQNNQEKRYTNKLNNNMQSTKDGTQIDSTQLMP